MKKIVLYAYDQINLGDDLFIHTITKRYPNVQFYLWSDKKNQRTFSSLKNLKVIDKDSRWIRFLKRVHPSLLPRYKCWQENCADAVVYIGGSIFIEYDSWVQVQNWWRYEVENHKMFVLGANFGPYKSEAYREAMGGVFDKVQDICFRDKYSYELFLGHKVRWAPDILFTCPMPICNTFKRQIFLSVIHCPTKNEGEHTLEKHQTQYLDNLCSLTREYIQQGYTVVLASFCKVEKDEETIRELQERLSTETSAGILKKICYDGTNTLEMLQTITESEYIIASRFHAVILGIAAERPVFPIVYSDKTIHVLEDIGFQGNYADLRDNKEISFEEVIMNQNKESILSSEKLRMEAEVQFQYLDQIMMKEK